jgi:hypothetical protein
MSKAQSRQLGPYRPEGEYMLFSDFEIMYVPKRCMNKKIRRENEEVINRMHGYGYKDVCTGAHVELLIGFDSGIGRFMFLLTSQKEGEERRVLIIRLPDGLTRDYYAMYDVLEQYYEHNIRPFKPLYPLRRED